MTPWYHTSLFSLFFKNNDINISKFNVLKLDFFDSFKIVFLFHTKQQNSFERVLTNLIILFPRVVVLCIILPSSDI